MLQIAIHKFKYLDVLKIYKGYFLCEKGDQVDTFTEHLFSENAVVNWSGIVEANSLFEMSQADALPFEFTLEFKLIKSKSRRSVFLETVLQLDVQLLLLPPPPSPPPH